MDWFVDTVRDLFNIPEGYNDFSFIGLLKLIGTGFKDVFGDILDGLKAGLRFLYNIQTVLDDTSETVLDLTENNSIHGIGLNDYMGNIRFATGDIVYLQLYAILMIGVTLFILLILGKLFQLIRILVDKFLHINLTGVFELGFLSKIKNIFG